MPRFLKAIWALICVFGVLFVANIAYDMVANFPSHVTVNGVAALVCTVAAISSLTTPVDGGKILYGLTVSAAGLVALFYGKL